MTEWMSMKRRFALRVVLCIGAVLTLANCEALESGGDSSGGQAQLTREQMAPALTLARASRANGDLASAINLYRSVVASQPADPAVEVEFGDALVDAGSLDAAIDVYNHVDRQSAAWIGALLGLQQAYLGLANPAKALEYADQAYVIAPDDHRVLIGRGVALDMLGRHADAQVLYRAVLAATPHNVAARNDLALSLALTRQFREAIDIMSSLARQSTATPRIRQNLAFIYGLAGDIPRATALSRIDLDPNTTEANLRFFEFVRNEDEQ